MVLENCLILSALISFAKTLATGFANLFVAAVGGVCLSWFLAQQRSRRLHQQLRELSKIVGEDGLDESRRIWLEDHESLTKWTKELERIKLDVDKSGDRFVRLNTQRKRELELLLSSLPESLHALDVLYAQETGRKASTPRQHVLDRIQNYRTSLRPASFFESPWPIRIKD